MIAKKEVTNWYLNFTNTKKFDKELLEAFHVSSKSIFHVAEENNKIVDISKVIKTE